MIRVSNSPLFGVAASLQPVGSIAHLRMTRAPLHKSPHSCAYVQLSRNIRYNLTAQVPGQRHFGQGATLAHCQAAIC